MLLGLLGEAAVAAERGQVYAEVVLVVVMVWEWEGGEGWRVKEEGEEKVTMEVVEGTEKRTVESYLCEKAAEVEDGSG